MIFAIIFFAGGLFLLSYKSTSKIILGVTPTEACYRPVVNHQAKTVEISDNGRTEISVKDDHNLLISNDALVKELTKLKLELYDVNDISKTLSIEKANSSKDSGYGF